MTAKRYRGFGQRLGTCLFATLVLGACATDAQAQVQFSAWPICNEGPFTAGLVSSGTGTGSGIDGYGLFQPVPPKPAAWELSRVCFGGVFVDSAGLDLTAENLPSSGWVIGYLGNPPLVGESPGTPAFTMSVGLSPLTAPDTGYRTGVGAIIRRVCVSIPTQVIPANETLSISVVAELDPVVGYMAIIESALLEPSIHNVWTMDFSLDQNGFGDFSGGSCDDIMALELYGPNPIPTVSEWGLVAMTLLMMTVGTLACRSRMAKPAGVRDRNGGWGAG